MQNTSSRVIHTWHKKLRSTISLLGLKICVNDLYGDMASIYFRAQKVNYGLWLTVGLCHLGMNTVSRMRLVPMKDKSG